MQGVTIRDRQGMICECKSNGRVGEIPPFFCLEYARNRNRYLEVGRDHDGAEAMTPTTIAPTRIKSDEFNEVFAVIR
jgi:hypothetical protein